MGAHSYTLYWSRHKLPELVCIAFNFVPTRSVGTSNNWWIKTRSYALRWSATEVQMGRSRYKILDDRYPYFITSSVVNGRKVFDDDTYRNIIIDGLNFLSQKREIEIYAYVIMPNHVHLIAKGDELGMYFARFKSFSARCILDLLLETGRSGLLSEFRLAKRIFKTDREHQFWCEGFHPKQISDMKMMRQKISYIHYNPVKAGLVEKQEDWKYSSYKDYNGSFNELVDIRHYRP